MMTTPSEGEGTVTGRAPEADASPSQHAGQETDGDMDAQHAASAIDPDEGPTERSATTDGTTPATGAALPIREAPQTTGGRDIAPPDGPSEGRPTQRANNGDLSSDTINQLAAALAAATRADRETMISFAAALRPEPRADEAGATRAPLSARVTRTYDAEIPKLEGGNITPQTMACWLARFTAWSKIEGISEYTLGPTPPTPTNARELHAHNLNLQEGLKYICAAIADGDLKQSLAKRAGNSGVRAMEILKADFMGGQQVQPILRQMLRDMRLSPERSPQVFKSQWLSQGGAVASCATSTGECAMRRHTLLMSTSGRHRPQLAATLRFASNSTGMRTRWRKTKN